MEEVDNVFRYVYSSSMHERIQVKVGTLEGLVPKSSHDQLLANPLLSFSGVYSEACPSLRVRLQVFNMGKPFGLPVTTSYKAFTKRYNWNEWVTLPIQFSDLPVTAMLALTILDCAGAGRTTIIGGTTISFFGKNGMYRQGMYDLRVWIHQEANGDTITKTPGKGKDSSQNKMQRLAKLSKKHRNGQMATVDWLDRLVFREIELVNEREKQSSEQLYLLVEFQTVVSAGHTYAILYYEPDGDTKYTVISRPKLVTVPDSEILQDNLVEKKHHRLARSARSDALDRDLKPNSVDRDQLHNIVHSNPPNYIPTSEEQDLIWKFRFHLSTDRHALVVFLRCINWETATEVRQALALLEKWDPMDSSDALALLSPDFTQPALRKYAIARLQMSSDDELLLYLLQLVQALKYENLQQFEEQLTPDTDVIQSIEDTLNAIDNQSVMTTSSIHTSNIMTHTDVEPCVDLMATSDISDGQVSDTESAVNQRNLSASMASNNNNNFDAESVESATVQHSVESVHIDNVTMSLSSFLVQRACSSLTLANYFYWYLYIECEQHEETTRTQDIRTQSMYKNVLRNLKRTLDHGSPSQKLLKHTLDKQQLLIEELVKLVKLVAKEPGNRMKKTERFQQLLADPNEFRINFTTFEPIPFPLDPNVIITGIIPDQVVLFKSALTPSRLTFTTNTNEHYVAIFKYGDDLRQDQLIMQMITLMDRLLRCENLDLKLTPYRVLATSSKHGFMQFIDSVTVADACNTEGSLQNFFRKHHPCETAPYRIEPEVMDTYIKSCAGYCVITYLLGVGDRHLDNLLLTTSGNLFHIDFGYILGRDPKPMPPPMKLSKEMVDAMGGLSSDTFYAFRKLCYTAYLHLRRQSKVMLNLFALMVDASIPDIALEPDKAVKKVEENLQMNLNDEAAIQHLQNVIDESVSAFMPAMIEHLHRLAQMCRR